MDCSPDQYWPAAEDQNGYFTCTVPQVFPAVVSAPCSVISWPVS
jgi:hypothetical protein